MQVLVLKNKIRSDYVTPFLNGAIMIKSYINKLTTRQKLLTFQTLFIIILYFAIAFYLITGYSDSILDSKKDSIQTSLTYVNNNLSTKIKSLEAVDLDVRASDDIKSNLNKTDYIEYGRAFTKITDNLFSKVLSTSGLRHAVIIDMCNHVYTVDVSLQLPTDFNLRDTEIFKAVCQNPSKLVWMPENDIYNKYVQDNGDYRMRSNIHAASLIKNYATGDIQGLLILTLNPNYFQDSVNVGSDIDNTDLYLISKDRTACHVLSSDEAPIPEEVLSALDFDNFESNSVTLGNKMVLFEKNKEMDWFVVCVGDIEEIRQNIRESIVSLLIIIGIAMLIFLILSNGVFNSMTKDIGVLAENMEKFAQGDFDTQIEAPGNDEIGRLSQNFNQMVRKTSELIDTQYRMELRTQETEFKSLQAQINPHFLYNILDMLNWQLVIRGEEKLSDSVVAIGNCLRYSISRDSTSATLQEEINNIRDYVTIQTLINDKPIDFFVDAVDTEIIVLPKLTLQPLVENCFLHGFNGRDTNNSLAVVCSYTSADRSKYCISVSDNGIGMSEDTKNSILPNDSGENSEHVGLRNVFSRLKYMYKDAVDFDIQSSFGYGTTINIIIKIENREIKI